MLVASDHALSHAYDGKQHQHEVSKLENQQAAPDPPRATVQ